VDKLSEANVKEDALKILKAKNMAFTNLLLDEEEEFWQKKLDTTGVPCIFVFNREGKYKKFEAADIDNGGYARIEKLVVEWLKNK
jgi:hypothetical protein